VKDETEVLRAGQEQHSADEGVWGDLGSMDELLLAEAKVPPAERQIERGEVDYESADTELPAYTGQLPQSAVYAERQVSGGRPKKNRSTIFIGVAGVLVLLLVGIIIWSVSSDSSDVESEIEAKLPEAKQFAEDYIYLLKDGKIDEVRGLLSSEIQVDVRKDEIERFAEQIGKGEIIRLDCEQTHFEKSAEGEQIFLRYNLRYEDR
jgi:hypothetical protein